MFMRSRFPRSWERRGSTCRLRMSSLRMGNRQVVLTRVFRFVLIIVLFLILAAIAWYMVSRRRPPSVEPLKVESIPVGKAEQQEGIEHYDFKGERVIRVRAERHYAGGDGRFYLVGNVEVREIDKKEGKEKLIRGERISYDRDWNEIILEGRASVQQEGFKIESSTLHYQKNPETISTDSGAAFVARKVSGQAKRLRYSSSDDSLWLEDNVELELKSDEPESAGPVVIKGGNFAYSRQERKGKIGGREVVFSQGQNHGQAELLLFELTADEQTIDKIGLQGNARVTIVTDEERAPGEGDLLLAAASKREIEAPAISLVAFPDAPRIQFLTAEGGCSLKSITATGAFAHVRSESLNVVFDSQGGLKEFMASGKASLEERRKDGGLERLLSGQDVLIEGQGSKVTARAGPREEARLDSADSEVMARMIALFPRQEVVEAAEEVRAVLKPKPEGEEKVGFFGRQKPVFITARRMRFEKGQNRLIFREKIRVWQEKNMILAEEMTILRETGEMAGDGPVRAVFVLPAKGEKKEEERIEIGGGRMNFDPRANLLTFEPGAWVKAPNGSLEGQILVVTLAEGSADILTIQARGKTVVKDELREGRSEEAVYDLEKETMVLTGSPVVMDKNRGVVRGDKLTFHKGGN
ncbi:MAG: hypothetical protein FJY81_01000, partial [Candidatus Aminicenantes bacterium]|nr:hypothetical protein [Candidatus Aminicenantes bacterium]